MPHPLKTNTAPGSLIGAFLIVLGLAGAAKGQSSVSLSWEPSPDPTLVGYRVYQGTASHVYTLRYDLASAVGTTITGLIPGTTYYLGITAYNAGGLESPIPAELIWTAPAWFQVNVNNSSQVVLACMGPAANTYAVLASQDLKTWATNGTFTFGPTGRFQFTDRALATNTSRFYRLQRVSP